MLRFGKIFFIESVCTSLGSKFLCVLEKKTYSNNKTTGWRLVKTFPSSFIETAVNTNKYKEIYVIVSNNAALLLVFLNIFVDTLPF